ncbi:UNVERIFIED_CONTAM: hypothetical protein H355_001267 [Colinus virginianus]|nr:hypothetical protein H355_001267 [Colinus virginianus]
MLLGGGYVEKMRSVQLSLGVLAILTMTVYVPSTHGVPFFLLGKLEYRLDDTGSISFGTREREWHVLCAADNRVLPEREDTNHKDTLLPLLNKKFAWRTPGNFGKRRSSFLQLYLYECYRHWELAKKFDDFEQLLKFKDQLSAEEGSEVADALESLSASQPKKRETKRIAF